MKKKMKTSDCLLNFLCSVQRSGNKIILLVLLFLQAQHKELLIWYRSICQLGEKKRKAN